MTFNIFNVTPDRHPLYFTFSPFNVTPVPRTLHSMFNPLDTSSFQHSLLFTFKNSALSPSVFCPCEVAESSASV